MVTFTILFFMRFGLFSGAILSQKNFKKRENENLIFTVHHENLTVQ